MGEKWHVFCLNIKEMDSKSEKHVCYFLVPDVMERFPGSPNCRTLITSMLGILEICY